LSGCFAVVSGVDKAAACRHRFLMSL